MKPVVLGYGRYTEDPEHVGCPRAKTSESACVARDGRLALDDGTCVTCDKFPVDLLTELKRALALTPPSPSLSGRGAADRLQTLVRRVTEPRP